MKYCQHCGKELEDGAQFCTGCGFSVTPVSNVQSQATMTSDTPAALKDGKTAMILGIVSLLFLTPMGIAAIIYSQKSKNENNGVYCGNAKAGLILGILALCWLALWVFIWIGFNS